MKRSCFTAGAGFEGFAGFAQKVRSAQKVDGLHKKSIC
jgi:hypothetical protein